MIARLHRFVRRLWVDDSGAMAVVTALTSVIVIGMAALSIDLGFVYACQLKLQSATDAAALAGAQELNVSSSAAQTTAINYSAAVGGTNSPGNFTAWVASGYPQVSCDTSLGACGPTNFNKIVVKENGRVPAFFGGIFGISNYYISANATAGSKGGAQGPVDVMIVMDAVGGSSLLALNPSTIVTVTAADPAALTDIPNAPCRMNTSATSGTILTYVLDILLQQCNASSGSKISQALGGVQTFLTTVQPCAPSLSTCGAVTSGNVANPFARVGLTVFPGFDTAADAQDDYQTGACAMPAATVVAPYWATAPQYEVVPLSSDYRTSDSATSLNSSSNMALAAGGASGCGAWAINPVVPGLGNQLSRGLLYGSFYASAITAAQTALTNEGRPGARKVIIFVSDGNANALSQVVGATVTASGSGYTAGANVTFTGGMGSGATGVATVVGGVVTGITILNGGSGFSAVGPPTISITPKDAIIVAGIPVGGHGSGAAAVVTLNPGVDQCHQGIAAAQAAQSAGTTIYSVAYGASVFPLLTCLTDILPQPSYIIPLISSCTTMQDIASDSSKFYSVNLNGSACASSNSASTLNAVFAAIATDIGAPRLLPNT